MKTLRSIVFAAAFMGSGLLAGITALAGDQPLAVSPGDGQGTLVSGACPTFSWGAVPGAASYELITYQVPQGFAAKTSPAELTELWSVTLPGTARAWTPAADHCFTHGGSYAWAVRAVTGGEPGPWSEANLFTIEKAPSAQEVRGMMSELRRYLQQTRVEGSRPERPRLSSPKEAEAARLIKGSTDERQAERRLVEQEKTFRALAGKGSSSRLRSVSRAASTPTLGTPSLSVDANIALGASSNVFKDGRVLLWNDTSGNLALGDSALASVSYQASQNTAIGHGALQATYGSSTIADQGSLNSAMGYKALFTNTTGWGNTAIGVYALRDNTTGDNNTANGLFALRHNTSASLNTATGTMALETNTTGTFNTATGSLALNQNTSGSYNTASGYDALRYNTDGYRNTATGFEALRSNTTGFDNTASGHDALRSNTDGYKNSATGYDALFSNTRGNRNVAVGYAAGKSPVSPVDSIFIANQGSSGDTTTIKIGTEGTQTSTFIAGIRKETTGNNDAIAVLIDSAGQLGTASSSRRYKQDIEDMGDATDKLYELRPVTFRYKKYVQQAITEGKNPEQLPRSYGLIAEEVAKVFPDLVVYGKDGKPETIKYRLLAPMLLNELQKEHWEMIEQADELAREREENHAQQAALANELQLGAEVAALKSQISHLETRVAAIAAPSPRPSRRATPTATSKLKR